MNTSRTGKLSSIQRYLVVAVMLAAVVGLLCIGAGVFYVYSVRAKAEQEEAVFCTAQDEIFQAIKANILDWKQYFSVQTSDVISHDPTMKRFEVLNRGNYTVRANVWEYTDTTRIFTVTIDYGIGAHTPPEGLRGYLYTENGKVPKFSSSDFQIKFVSDNIYCYWLKR